MTHRFPFGVDGMDNSGGGDEFKMLYICSNEHCFARKKEKIPSELCVPVMAENRNQGHIWTVTPPVTTPVRYSLVSVNSNCVYFRILK